MAGLHQDDPWRCTAVRCRPPSTSSRPNPAIDFESSPFYLNDTARPWPGDDGPRRAGVSSFGMGGTNAHVVLEEPPATAAAPPAPPATGPHLLVLSARTVESLDRQTRQLRDWVGARPDVDLADVAANLGRRQPMTHRRFLVAADPPTRWPPSTRHNGSSPAFIPVAVGPWCSPSRGTARSTWRWAPVCTARRRPTGRWWTSAPNCSATTSASTCVRCCAQRPTATRRRSGCSRGPGLIQPALFVTGYALARSLLARGVTPDLMVGHSLGEYVAACLAGVFSLADALRLVSARGELVERTPAGAMLAVSLPETAAAGLAVDGVSLAAVNAPELCVLSGAPEAIEELRRRLTADGVGCRPLRVTRGYHSALLDPVLDEFADHARRVTYQEPQRPYLANLTGGPVAPGQVTDPAYWVRHMREPVRFAESAALLAEQDVVLAELGPGHALGGLARLAGVRPGQVVAAMRHPRSDADDLTTMLDAVGRLWLSGGRVDWQAFHGGPRRRLALPGYPFERRRHWVDAVSRPDTAQPAPVPFERYRSGGTRAGRGRQPPAGQHRLRRPEHARAGDRGGAVERAARDPADRGARQPLRAGWALAARHPVRRAAAGPARRRAAAGDHLRDADRRRDRGHAAADRPRTHHHRRDRSPAPQPTIPRADPDAGPAPLSSGQHRLWFLDQAYEQSAYTVGTALLLDGTLDVDALRGALAELTRRHESLRTVFPLGPRRRPSAAGAAAGRGRPADRVRADRRETDTRRRPPAASWSRRSPTRCRHGPTPPSPPTSDARSTWPAGRCSGPCSCASPTTGTCCR